MLSKKEKRELLKQFWKPDTAYGAFCWALESWCSDFKTPNQGIEELIGLVWQKYGMKLYKANLYGHLAGRYHTVSLRLAVAAISVILQTD